MTHILAPVVLFVFARPDHTRRTLEALAANGLAGQSDLVIYADAARNEQDAAPVREVRDLIQAVSGFRSVTIIQRETNYGLARNITEGVTETCNKHGRVIVMEDDVVAAPEFLSFMNAALDQYEDAANVWHISGWNYPIDPEGLGNAFFWRVMNCWGWATWADRWKHFDKDPQRLIKSWDKDKVRRFNLDGTHDFWAQVKDNQKGTTNTWAIFWYATIFERGGLCLNPTQPFVRNIGIDGSGENCIDTDPYLLGGQGHDFNDLPVTYEESVVAVQRVKAFFNETKPHLTGRALRGVMHAVSRLMGSR